jgi:hypothetical protein
MRRPTLLLLAALALSGVGCHDDGASVLVLVVTASGSPPAVSALTVTITLPSGSASQTYAHGGGELVRFPTTLSAELPATATGSATIGVAALDATGATVASGQISGLTITPGARPMRYVSLTCTGAGCALDGGTSASPDGGSSSGGPRCGNGRVDLGETCDTAIAPGDPGACPASCDDGVACTRDITCCDGVACAQSMPPGNPCTISCTHAAVTQVSPTDGCCPAAATHATDPDCSPTCGDGVLQPGETCDTAIAAGLPGACPTPSECSVADPCAVTLLLSVATCQAICMHYQVTIQRSGDGCCPPGGSNAVDTDCPAVCGDGVRQSAAGESCDVGIASSQPGSCPQSCDDSNDCTTDFLSGTGCRAVCVHTDVTAPISGDGCCPMGATRATDTDCPARCGDGVIEPGEACDNQAAAGAGACPTVCPPSPSVCLQTTLTGSADDCSATCVSSPITACGPLGDGCCPTGCTAATDPDCSPTCGDGVVQPGETCDVAIAAGGAGACPAVCDDGDPCTTDLLLSAGTCSATCVHLAVTAFVAGDGCCPPGGDLTVDADCTAVCGDAVVEPPVETCDEAVVDSCPTDCPAAGTCTTSSKRGSPATCSAACITTPITACVAGDGCCPIGCTAATDSDCPSICGDGVVEPGEQCDRAITAGFPGACPRTCDDGDACTVDVASGSSDDCSSRCTHATTVACLSGDGCCPPGCTAATDHDCAPATCNDGHIEAGETCDPPATCPTTCPDDGDPCTTEVLVGDPSSCNAACRHLPITTCSGSASDRCCPTGCTPANDSDC